MPNGPLFLRRTTRSIFEAIEYHHTYAPSPVLKSLRPVICVKFASEMDNPLWHKYGVVVPAAGTAPAYHSEKASDYREAFARIVTLFESSKEWSTWGEQIKFAWCPTARRDLAVLSGTDASDHEAWKLTDDTALDVPLIEALYPAGVDIEFVGFHAYGTWRASRPSVKHLTKYPWLDDCAFMEEASPWWGPPEYYIGPALRALTQAFGRTKRYLIGELGVASIPKIIHEAVIDSANLAHYKNTRLRLSLRIDESSLAMWVDRLFSKSFWIRRAAEYLRLWSQARNIHLTVLLFEENKIDYAPKPGCPVPDFAGEKDWSFTNDDADSYETKEELLNALAAAMVMGYPGGDELSGWNWSTMDSSPVAKFRWYAQSKTELNQLVAEISNNYGDGTIYDADSLPFPEGFQP